MGTMVSLSASGLGDDVADLFFERIRRLEALLSRFRPGSELSRLAAGEIGPDDAAPAVREVLTRCDDLRRRTAGCFDHQPRRSTGDPSDPVLDPNAFAKGWIVDEAATTLRLAGADDFFVNAGGDVLAIRPAGARPWRIGVQHPHRRGAVLGVLELVAGAVATSGAYERGDHIRSRGQTSLASVTVVGPDLADADALATAVHASGEAVPAWWPSFDSAYGLLTVTDDLSLRWIPPTTTSGGVAVGVRTGRGAELEHAAPAAGP